MRRWLRALALAACLAMPAAARADSGSDLLKVVGTVLVFIPGLQAWGYGFLVAGTLLGGVEQRRTLRKAEQRRRREYNDALQARNITVLTSEPPMRGGYGRCVTGGDVLAIITTDKVGRRQDGATYTKPDALQHVVVHLLSRQSAAIHEVFIDGVPVGPLDANGYPTGGDFHTTHSDTRIGTLDAGGSLSVDEEVTGIMNAFTTSGVGVDTVYTDVTGSVSVSGAGSAWTFTGPAGATVNYTIVQNLNSVRVGVFLGAPDQAADPYLMSVAPTKWTANHRGQGLTLLRVTFDLEDPRFQGGLPNITAEGSWALLYDPRKDSAVPGGSGSHRVDDPATWEWSDNPALATDDWLRSEMGYGVTPADIDVAYTIAAANACAATGTFDDGAGPYTAARYTCNGTFTSEQSREAVLEDLTESMGGTAICGAQWQINAGAWTPPVVELTDADLAGSVEIVQADSETDALLNGAHGRYIPAGKSQPADANPPYSNPVLVAADGGTPLVSDYTFMFTSTNARVRDLLRMKVEQTRAGKVIQYPAKLKHWGLRVGERVYVTNATYNYNRLPFRITDRRYTQQAPVLLTLQADAASIWDQADAATAEPYPDTGLPNPFAVSPLAGLAAASGSANAYRNSDGIVTPRVKISWNAITDPRVADGGYVEVRWRRNTEVDFQKVAPVPGSERATYITGLRDGDVVVVNAWVRNNMRQLSDIRAATCVVDSGADTQIPTGGLAPNAATQVFTDSSGFKSAATILSETGITINDAGGLYSPAEFTLDGSYQCLVTVSYRLASTFGSAAQGYSFVAINKDADATDYGGRVWTRTVAAGMELDEAYVVTADFTLSAGQHVVGIRYTGKSTSHSPSYSNVEPQDVYTKVEVIRR